MPIIEPEHNSDFFFHQDTFKCFPSLTSNKDISCHNFFLPKNINFMTWGYMELIEFFCLPLVKFCYYSHNHRRLHQNFNILLKASCSKPFNEIDIFLITVYNMQGCLKLS